MKNNKNLIFFGFAAFFFLAACDDSPSVMNMDGGFDGGMMEMDSGTDGSVSPSYYTEGTDFTVTEVSGPITGCNTIGATQLGVQLTALHPLTNVMDVAVTLEQLNLNNPAGCRITLDHVCMRGSFNVPVTPPVVGYENTSNHTVSMDYAFDAPVSMMTNQSVYAYFSATNSMGNNCANTLPMVGEVTLTH